MNVPAPHNEKQTTTIATFSVRLTKEFAVDRVNSILTQTPKISKGVNPCVMSVRPARLQCIPAHLIESDKLEAFVGVAHVRAHDITKHVRLAPASCARATAPQQFEFQKRFGAVVPGNGEFVSDLLDVAGLKRHCETWPKKRRLSNRMGFRDRFSSLAVHRK